MNTKLFVFAEEQSAKIVLDTILPKILPANVEFNVYSHQGKQDLEKAIRKTLPIFSKIPGARIMIVRDQDSADCVILKQHLTAIVAEYCNAPYLIRIVCRELECWYLGDLKAIQSAYSRFNIKKHENKKDFRNVDVLQNAVILLKSIIPEYSSHKHLPKIECANKIAPLLDVEFNTSESFLQFVSGVKKLCN